MRKAFVAKYQTSAIPEKQIMLKLDYNLYPFVLFRHPTWYPRMVGPSPDRKHTETLRKYVIIRKKIFHQIPIIRMEQHRHQSYDKKT